MNNAKVRDSDPHGVENLTVTLESVLDIYSSIFTDSNHHRLCSTIVGNLLKKFCV